MTSLRLEILVANDKHGAWHGAQDAHGDAADKPLDEAAMAVSAKNKQLWLQFLGGGNDL